MYPLAGGEKNRSILAIASGKILPETLNIGRKEASLENKRQLQGKTKTKVLMRQLKKTVTKIKLLQEKRNRDGINNTAEKRDTKQTLTSSTLKFKQERIDQKVVAMIQTYHNVTFPNVHKRRTGHTLTPLISGKIQYTKISKAHNIQAVRNELIARGLVFVTNTTWTAMIKFTKEKEGHIKYFTPLIDYDSFNSVSKV